MALLAPTSGQAITGFLSDPDDIPMEIDVKRVTHSDTEDTLTYTVEAYEAWPSTDSYGMRWDFDLDNIDQGQSDALLTIYDNGADDPGTARVINGTNTDDIVGDATFSISGATLTVSFPRSFFEEDTDVALDESSYTYRMSATDFSVDDEDEETDFVPDVDEQPIVHTLGNDPTTTTTAPATTTTLPVTTTTSTPATTTTTIPGSTTTTSTTAVPATTTTTRPTTTTRVLTVATMPRTGAPNSTTPMVALSAVLILVGAVLIGAGKRPEGNYFR